MDLKIELNSVYGPAIGGLQRNSELIPVFNGSLDYPIKSPVLLSTPTPSGFLPSTVSIEFNSSKLKCHQLIHLSKSFR